MTAAASALGSSMRESAANREIFTARRVAYRLHFLKTELKAPPPSRASELSPESSESASLLRLLLSSLLLLLLLLVCKSSSSLLST
jgi:hypothetical protein